MGRCSFLSPLWAEVLAGGGQGGMRLPGRLHGAWTFACSNRRVELKVPLVTLDFEGKLQSLCNSGVIFGIRLLIF